MAEVTFIKFILVEFCLSLFVVSVSRGEFGWESWGLVLNPDEDALDWGVLAGGVWEHEGSTVN